MNIWIMLAFGSALLVSIAYCSLITLFTFGWFRKRNYNSDTTKDIITISVIIAARNEETKIGICLNAIIAQDYPHECFEVIVVNDHSTDNTVLEIIRVIAANSGIRIKLLQLSGDEQGKKTAIAKAVSVAKNEWIITTDADCTMGKNWLYELISSSRDPQVQMILAPVFFQKTKTLFGNLQELEFLSLIASSAGAASVGFPIMCNGANLAYRKSAYERVGGFNSDKIFASGDDMFLMMKIRKMYGAGAISFVKTVSAGVITNVAVTMSEFFNQRLRWISKSRGYIDSWVLLTSVIVFAQSFFLLIALFGWLAGAIGLTLFILLFTAKFIFDLPLLAAICRFANRGRLMFWYLPLQLIYPVYIVGIGLLGNILSFTWKGRKFQ
jgi:cellulose synthase/poly-beta-1,6-N-acetylglucosamine synthase-like glycosyltransferase